MTRLLRVLLTLLFSLSGPAMGENSDFGRWSNAANATVRWGPATGAGPLGEGVAATFRGSSYTQAVTQEATTLTELMVEVRPNLVLTGHEQLLRAPYKQGLTARYFHNGVIQLKRCQR